MRFLIFFFLFKFALLSQGRSDFYDSYDYDLRNYKGGGTLTGSDYYREFKIPPQKRSNPLITPKSVVRPTDPNLIIPSASGFRRPTTSTSQTNITSLPVNPITGELNIEAILKSQDAAKQKKEEQKKIRESFEPSAYKETKERRAEIIFLMSYPFALAIAAGIGAMIDAATPEPRNIFGRRTVRGWVYTPTGGAFIFGTSLALAGANTYLDRLRIEEREKKSGLGFLESISDRRVEFTIGEKSF
ncbi:MAG: hypothetical protein SFU98_18835 [Leptospiraceae bacterium]|nr:hypothetical protein [Leptospiraceae bacterium]